MQENKPLKRILFMADGPYLDSLEEMGVVYFCERIDFNRYYYLTTFKNVPTESELISRAEKFAEFAKEGMEKYNCEAVLVKCQEFFVPFLISAFQKANIEYHFPVMGAKVTFCKRNGVRSKISLLTYFGFFP